MRYEAQGTELVLQTFWLSVWLAEYTATIPSTEGEETGGISRHAWSPALFPCLGRSYILMSLTSSTCDGLEGAAKASRRVRNGDLGHCLEEQRSPEPQRNTSGQEG